MKGVNKTKYVSSILSNEFVCIIPVCMFPNISRNTARTVLKQTPLSWLKSKLELGTTAGNFAEGGYINYIINVH